jgi:hypothetical protein
MITPSGYRCLRPQIEDAAAQEFLAPSELVRQILRKALSERQIERSKKRQQCGEQK